MERVDYTGLKEASDQFRADKEALSDFIDEYTRLVQEIGTDGNVWGGTAATNAKESLEKIKTMLTELRDKYVTQLSSYADTYIRTMIEKGDTQAYGQKQ